MKSTSSHIVDLLQFQKNAPYMTILSCFMYKMNESNHCFKVSLVGFSTIMWLSPITFAWVWMMGTTNVHSWQTKVCYLVLNKLGVVCIVRITTWAPTSRSTNCPTPNSSSFVLRSSNVLALANVSYGTSPRHYLMKSYLTQGCHGKPHKKKPWCKRKTQLKNHPKTQKTAPKLPKP